jgi:hypothetical protein
MYVGWTGMTATYWREMRERVRVRGDKNEREKKTGIPTDKQTKRQADRHTDK